MISRFCRQVITSLALFLAVCSHSTAESRLDSLINEGWKFTRENPASAEAVTYNDSYWESISLPHTWNARDGQDGGNDYYRGTGWYRKSLTLGPAYKGKSVFLKFDGVATTTRVFVNGKPAGMHKGNFGAFCFDVSSLVTFDGANLVAVKVTNARDTSIAPLRGDFTVFGGIYRNVHLLVLEKLSISPLDHASPGVYVKQSHVTQEVADLEVTTVLRNASLDQKKPRIRCSILDLNGAVLKTVESTTIVAPGSQINAVQNVSLRSPHLWSGRQDPYLHQMAIEILEGNMVMDRLVQPFGLRYFSVDPDKGFILNGKPYRLHGVNRHQDRENKGWAIGIGEHREDYALLEDIGCSAVRLAHYQQAAEFYELCDRGGMVVWAELALVDDIHPNAAFALGCREQLTELIKQNFNHPSIMFWGIFNELMPDSNRELYGKVVADLNLLARTLDPTRLTTMASRSRYEGNEYINNVTDVVGYNVYRGWYEGKPEDFAAFVDSLHSRFPKLRFCISEYGAGAGISQHEVPPKKPHPRGPWHPEEWQATLHEITWKAMEQRPYLWGTFVWNMFDFGSDGRAEGELPGRNDKGLVTYDRAVKKDAYFWYKAHWNPEPMVYITSKRFAHRPSGATEVKVYSNCDSVSLSVNGISMGTKVSDDKKFVWDGVPISLRTNLIEAVGFKGGRKLRDSCTLLTSLESETKQVNQ